jgi:hypothetical protein
MTPTNPTGGKLTAADPGRPVPPHGSGGGTVQRRDPDETAGRALYRAIADANARRSMAQTRRVKLFTETRRAAISPGSKGGE